MNYKESLKVLGGLLDAFDRDEHGDYFYEHGWEVCEATILAYGALENQPFWISVEERLPEESTEVLAVLCIRKIDGTFKRYIVGAIRLRDTMWVAADYQNGIRAYTWGTDVEDCCFWISHWKPLPELPKEEV